MATHSSILVWRIPWTEELGKATVERVTESDTTEVTWQQQQDYTVHGVLQTRILEWVAFPLSRDLPNPGIEARSPALQVDSLPAEP